MNIAAAAVRPTVVVGVSGGIAAFKALEVVRLLAESGCEVHVVPTLSALRFVGEASFAALSGNPCHTDLWHEVHTVKHVELARRADAVVVVPATADLMAKTASGMTGDLLSAIVLTATAPVIYVPAMHTEMWENPATQSNVATLRQRGAIVVEPASGRLTGADSGKGRLPDPSAIAALVRRVVASADLPLDFAGKHVLVTAGGTREPLDPIRYIGNRSSGKQGYAIAAEAVRRGARVTLISANVTLTAPAGVDLVAVETVRDLQNALSQHAAQADVVIMAAAVSDFTPVEVAEHKIKKSDENLVVEFRKNPDLLQGLVENRLPHQVIIGFAAETGDQHKSVLEHAKTKLAAKGCDALVVNDVSEGKVFGSDSNCVTVLTAAGESFSSEQTSKENVAITVCNVVNSLISRR